MAASAGRGCGRRRCHWRTVAWTGAALMLLLPWVAMQFTDEVNWSVTDFLVAGALIAGTGLAFELAAGTTANHAYRAAVGLALAAVFLLIWLNLAVGIIGTEDGQPPQPDVRRSARRRHHRCHHRALAARWNGTRDASSGARSAAGGRERARRRSGLQGAGLVADRLLRRAVARVGLAVSESGARANPRCAQGRPAASAFHRSLESELRRDRHLARVRPHHPGVIFGDTAQRRPPSASCCSRTAPWRSNIQPGYSAGRRLTSSRATSSSAVSFTVVAPILSSS
jgi:hypothetical protein